MRILVIEDEMLIAARIERMVKEILGPGLKIFLRADDIETGKQLLNDNEIDLVLLDLNLNGEDGFEVLKDFTARAFNTIIISAYREKAIEAFEYGVLDFVPKPFDRDRLQLALERANNTAVPAITDLKFLSVRQKGQLRLIRMEDVIYFKGSDIYAEVYLINGESLLHDKTLEKLSQLLGNTFERIHKSYLVCCAQFETISYQSGSPMMKLKNGEELPIGRTRYAELKKKLLD
jgi:two-component system response regulator LytT